MRCQLGQGVIDPALQLATPAGSRSLKSSMQYPSQMRSILILGLALLLLGGCGNGGETSPPPADPTLDWDEDNWDEKEWA